jgi:apolipoprotein N-acyltransferase
MTYHKREVGWLVGVVLVLLLWSEQPADAYVDPGSASYVFQLLVGTALGALFALRMCWERVKTVVRGLLPGSRTIRE